jgi:hypothetical protein
MLLIVIVFSDFEKHAYLYTIFCKSDKTTRREIFDQLNIELGLTDVLWTPPHPPWPCSP